MRCAIFSDIHGNLAALDTVLKEIGDQADQIWCLGDLVGYGPDPNECVERVREGDYICVVGNHDWACLGRIDLSEFNPDARRACAWTIEQLTPENSCFLDQLPASLVVDSYTLVHGSPRAPIWEYITHPGVALENFAFFDTPVCVVGHIHVPIAFHLPEWNPTQCDRRWLADSTTLNLSSGRWIVSPGGVGQPRDGDPRAAWAMLDTESRTFQLHRVDYPVGVTQRKMKKAGLPEGLINRLALGW